MVLVFAEQDLLGDGICSLLGEAVSASSVEEALRSAAEVKPEVMVLCEGSGAGQILQALPHASPDSAGLAVMLQDSPVRARRLMRDGARGVVSLYEPTRVMREAVRLLSEGQGYISPSLAAEVASLGDGQFAYGVTAREAEVLKLIGLGFTNQQIAERLYLSPRTVESHRSNILKKCDGQDRSDLVRLCLDMELI